MSKKNCTPGKGHSFQNSKKERKNDEPKNELITALNYDIYIHFNVLDKNE